MEIESGVLRGALPSELELAGRFQVSRPTIRESLEILRKAGLVESTRGQNHRIIAPAKTKIPLDKDEGVIILGFVPFEELSPFALFIINQIQQAASANYNVRIVCNANASPLAGIKEIASKHQYRCWVLIGPAGNVLEWFESSHLPCLAIGSSGSSVEIPLLAMDLRSVMLHAFALAGQRSYKGPFLLLPGNSENINRAFLQIQAKHRPGTPDIYWHDTTLDGVRKTVDRIVRAHFNREGPPALILAVRPKHALMVLSHLRERDFRPGRDFGLISIGYENYLDFVTPRMASYSINQQRMCKKFLRMFSEIMDSGYTRPGVFRVIADFCDGETFPRLDKKSAAHKEKKEGSS